MKTTLINRIEINPEILTGKPVIKGTRIAVEHIMSMLASGMAPAEILKEFPHLTKQDIQETLFYATSM